MNADRRSSGPGNRRDADDAGFNCEVRLRERFLAIAKLQSVTSAEIVGNDHGQFGSAVAADFHFFKRLVLRTESASANAVPDITLPHEIERRIRGEAFAAQHRAGSHRTLPGTQ